MNDHKGLRSDRRGLRVGALLLAAFLVTSPTTVYAIGAAPGAGAAPDGWATLAWNALVDTVSDAWAATAGLLGAAPPTATVDATTTDDSTDTDGSGGFDPGGGGGYMDPDGAWGG